MFNAIKNRNENTYNNLPVKSLWLYISAILFSIFIPSLIKVSGSLKFSLLLVVLLPIFASIIWNANIAIICLITSVFTRFGMFDYYLSVLITPLLIFSFPKQDIENENITRVKNPLSISFLIFLLSILPSIMKISDYGIWVKSLINFIAMIIVVTLVGKVIKNYSQLKKFLTTFLFLSVLNGLSVIQQSISTGGGRVFGFTGVYYIDIVNIAIFIAICIIIFNPKKRIYFIPLLSFFFISLLLTQTRNSILSLFGTSLVLFLTLLISSKKISIPKIKIINYTVISSLSLLIIAIILFLIFPQISERFLELFSPSKSTESTSLVSNSLVSRLLIWHTALNAFLKNPFTGIGLFNFQYISSLYHTIPNDLYKEFVWHLTPHVTYIAVLTETGIVGFSGFLTFLISIIVMNIKSLKKSNSTISTQYSLGLLICQVYIILSMALTDAWLWGQCGMLWSLLLGSSIANYKIVMKDFNNAVK